MTMNIIDIIKKKKRKEEADNTKCADYATRIYRNIFPLRFVCLGILFVFPFLTFDHWCVEKGLNYSDPQKACDPDSYPVSEFFKFQPRSIAFVYTMTYTVLGVFTVLRLFVKKRTKSANFRSAGMLLILLISIID